MTPPPSAPPAAGGRARLYRTARTAHLERAATLPPALLLFDEARYDFDPELARRVGAVQVGALGAARLVGRAGVTTLEVNEPALLDGARRTAVTLAWLGLRALLGRARPVVVTYAIDNLDPRDVREPGLRRRLARRVDLALARFVWSRCDRVAFGTPAAERMYAQAFPRHRRPLRTTVVPALPEPCGCVGDEPRAGAVFLGAFADRKGLPLLAAAWPHVARELPGARLTLVGKGPLEPLARELAQRADVDLLVDPPRDRIHAVLRSAQVLVLPSRRTARWREQVGLPIVEGLAHGCTVVTTSETGLADWLDAHGHHVVPDDGRAETVAEALAAALRTVRDPASVRADLPTADGRLAADAWMFADGDRAQPMGSGTA
ncbi:glycosyltransferase family 4 protein [Cellulomonas massiliensis]|uniref:glycosyltransferase family 4 protein n=1 Tax=Cellulomonas massiliensis TaxID=1465811 RepID=UPI0002F12C3A|nr:glycosyltransferase family 4 protein [Cellulomonas massiliensis]